MQSSLPYKRKCEEEYIKFISQFGPALRGMAFWNTNKTTKLVSELLTITDEAFIHLCIINYSATWKAQERRKTGETNVEVPVSVMIHVLICDCNQQMITNTIIIVSILGSPRLIQTLTETAEATCHVDGHNMVLKRSTN